MGGQTPAQSAAQALATFNANATLRSMHLPGTIAYGNGGGTFHLPHAGIPTFLVLQFNGLLTAGTGAVITASPFWPFNILGASSLVDYAGNTRVYAGGYSLHELELTKGPSVFDDVPYGSMAYASQIYAATIPAAGTSDPVIFSLIVPVAMSKGTAEGSYAAAVPNGEATYQLAEQSLNGTNVTTPFTVSGGTATLTGTWSMTYYYLDAPANVPLPIDALQTMHEVYEQQISAGLTAGATVDTILLTGRTYYRVIGTMVENNAPNILHVNEFDFLVDGSTPAVNEVLSDYLFVRRMSYMRDFPAGMFLYDFSTNPWSPNDYGSLTVRAILNSAYTPGTYANMTILRECLYMPNGNLISIGG